MKIVINSCYGGFSISDEGIAKLIEWGFPKSEISELRYCERYRNHPLLVRLVEEAKAMSDTRYSNLCVVEIPDGVKWTIEEYDGKEHVAEVHQTWS